MSNKPNHFRERISTFLAEHGLNQFRFVRRRKHPAVIITINGRDLIHAYSGTTSDRRSVDNCISDLRHRLGLVVATPKAANTNRPKRRNRRVRMKRAITTHPAAVPAVPVIDTYYAPLAALKARMAAAGFTATNDDGVPDPAA